MPRRALLRGLLVALFLFSTLAPARAAVWTERTCSGESQWNGIASSSDGAKLAATVHGGNIWTSTDFGETWTSRASPQNWRGITSSSDGTKLAATVHGGNIWTSTDAGETWTSRASPHSWFGITSSSDGTKLAATVVGGNIWTSTDSGETWTEVTPTESTQEEYPPGPLTSYDQTYIEGHGLFKAYASTDFGATPYRSWNAFDKTITTDGGENNGWATAANTWLEDGTTTPVSSLAATFDGVQCHWLELQLPYEINPTRLTLRARNTGNVPGEVPAKGRIYGSKDGATWDQITSYDIRTEVGTLLAFTDNEPISITLTTNEYYSHLKLTVDERYGGGSGILTSVGELRYFGAARKPQNWAYITSSSDGAMLAAAVTGGNIWTFPHHLPPPLTCCEASFAKRGFAVGREFALRKRDGSGC
jgi:photosystem II stability/assembly factor-like uncharacterized protein